MGAELIAITITMLYHGAVFVRDALHGTLFGLDVEAVRFRTATRPVGVCLLAGWYYGFHHVACLKAPHLFLAPQQAARKAMFCQSGALIAAPLGTFNRQRRCRPIVRAIEKTNAGGIKRIGLGDAEPLAVEVRINAPWKETSGSRGFEGH